LKASIKSQKSVLVAVSLLASASLMPSVATAQASAPAAASPHSFSYNIGLSSEYRYRGISQSRLKPAFSAGADYSHSGGFYLGAWASTIKWIKDAGSKGDIEVDLYGGYKFNVSKDVQLDVGVLAYVYPGNQLKSLYGTDANTTEVYLGATVGPVSAKYSHSVTPLFGFGSSKGSGYLELNGNFDMGGGLTVVGHLGHQRVAKNSAASYTDWKLGVTKDIEGFVLGGALVGTDNDGYLGAGGKNLGGNRLVLTVTKSF
jgi:uncharacterized protein (TIGR02001 family)